jgi:hypothetical protein
MTQRKVNMALAKKTPIRLVALDEEPDEDVTQISEVIPIPVEDTAPTPVEEVGPAQDACPTKITPEHDAITRRVPMIAAQVTKAPEWPKQSRSWRRLIPFLVALLPVAALSTAWFLSRAGQDSAKGKNAPAVDPDQRPAHAPEGAATPTTQPLPSAQGQAANPPEVIRLQITVDPVQAELGLDGNVLAGHRLNLEVPKDRGIHVISASAPGYVPFNQQVSFSNDVVLQINLRRGHGAVGRPLSRQSSSHARINPPEVGRSSQPASVQVGSKPQSPGEPRLAPSAPRTAPGMDLDMPASPHGARAIDERNPYRP